MSQSRQCERDGRGIATKCLRETAQIDRSVTIHADKHASKYALWSTVPYNFVEEGRERQCGMMVGARKDTGTERENMREKEGGKSKKLV